MKKNRLFTGLILAAGTGERFGNNIPKQYGLLSGLPVLRHTIMCFMSHPECREIHVVINPEHRELYNNAVKGLELPPPIVGGESRKESCYLGLVSLDHLNHDDPILIHDAARPFVTHKNINDVLEALGEHSSVTLGTPISETLRRSDKNSTLTDTLNRKDVWALQTPQGFRYGDLKNAHEKYRNDDTFTDDCGVMEAAGHKAHVLGGHRNNIKITWQTDLEEAENIMSLEKITVTGQGYDVHAFGNEQVEHIRLGGIDVPHPVNLKAHSDGDVVLHALTDAVLGTIGEGDIGLHFPPSDNTWKDKDSRYFIEEAIKMFQAKGGAINNADITLICEHPKLKDVRESMRESIAQLLGVSVAQVNVKATTTEKLGFTGRGEGIACQAVICANINKDALSNK